MHRYSIILEFLLLLVSFIFHYVSSTLYSWYVPRYL